MDRIRETTAKKLMLSADDQNKHIAHYGGNGELAFIQTGEGGEAVVLRSDSGGAQAMEGGGREIVEHFNKLARQCEIEKSDLISMHPEAAEWGLFPY